MNIRCGHGTGSRFTPICSPWRTSTSMSLLLVTDSLASWKEPQRTMGYLRDW